jgi:hypothetical protein
MRVEEWGKTKYSKWEKRDTIYGLEEKERFIFKGFSGSTRSSSDRDVLYLFICNLPYNAFSVNKTVCNVDEKMISEWLIREYLEGSGCDLILRYCPFWMDWWKPR